MSPQTTVLITGANRGIGRAITTTYLSRPNYTIIALTRDPTHATSQSLLTEPHGENSKITLLAYDASLLSSADTALTSLRTTHPDITHIDTVIANAGFSDYFGPSLDASPETYIHHYTVNTLGPFLLLRATLPFLTATSVPSPTNPTSKANSTPKFIAISSAAGSTTRITSSHTQNRDTTGRPRRGALPYTSSKCALNHVMAKLSAEYPEVAVGLFTPGPTMTGFGGAGVNWEVIPGAQGVEGVVEGLVGLFDGVGEGGEGKETKFVLRDWKGEEIAW